MLLREPVQRVACEAVYEAVIRGKGGSVLSKDTSEKMLLRPPRSQVHGRPVLAAHVSMGAPADSVPRFHDQHRVTRFNELASARETSHAGSDDDDLWAHAAPAWAVLSV